MHEVGFAESVVRVVLSESDRYPGRPVQEVEIRVGTRLGIEKASLGFCLEAMVEGTRLSGTRFLILDDPPEWHCERCQVVRDDCTPDWCCPCGGGLRPAGGMDITIVEMKVG